MVRVAAVQMKVTGDPDINTERMASWIKSAKSRNVKIVCFPETSLISDHTNIKNASTYLEKISAACKDSKIFCIFSSYSKENGKNYNIAYVMDYNGNIVHKYRKKNLWGIEKKYIKPGNSNRIVKTKYGNIGVIVCYDYADPKNAAKLKSADIIFCPSFMVDYQGARDVIRSFPVMRAFENMSYLVMCDAFTKRTACMSCIASPFRIVKKAGKKENMIVADININRIRNLKKKFQQ